MNVGIFGTSYCGSTLTSYIFTKHPKVFSVGESHWLVDKAPYNRKKILHDNCTICRDIPNEDCDFFTREFIDTLTMNNLVEKIEQKAKEKYDVDWVMYSDKHPYNYNRLFFNVNKKMDKALVLFKRPEGFLHSFLRHYKITHPDLSERQIFDDGIRFYIKINRENQECISKNNIPVRYIFLEDLTKDPVKIIKYICDFLNIEFDNSLLQYWENNNKFHQIGGNGSPKISTFNDGRVQRAYGKDTDAHKWYRKIHKKIVFDQRWKDLDENYLDILKHHFHVQETFNKMLARRTYE